MEEFVYEMYFGIDGIEKRIDKACQYTSFLIN